MLLEPKSKYVFVSQCSREITCRSGVFRFTSSSLVSEKNVASFSGEKPQRLSFKSINGRYSSGACAGSVELKG